MRNAREVSKWLKQNFRNGEELGEFTEYLRLLTFLADPEIRELIKKKISKNYNHATLNKFKELYKSIKNLPTFVFIEKGKKYEHRICMYECMFTPIEYINHKYKQDCKARNALLGQ